MFVLLFLLISNSAVFALPQSNQDLANRAASLAEEVIGAPYLWGGKGWDYGNMEFADSPTISSGYYYWNETAGQVEWGQGIDCSGLSFWSYNKAAGATKHTDSSNPIHYEGASEQWHDTERFKKLSNDIPTVSDLRIGDLLFLDTRDRGIGVIDHVGMYVGNGNVTHSSGRNGVEKKNLSQWLNLPTPGGGTYKDFFYGYGRVKAASGPKFNIGDNVKVIAENGWNIRSEPKLGDEYILVPPSPLPKGSEGQILEHDDNGISVDGHYWWYVKFGNYNGWCAEDGLERLLSASQGKMLIDRTHGFGYDISGFTNYLVSQGWTVDQLSAGPITPNNLEGYAVFLMPFARIEFTSSEIDSIVSYVEDGGGIWILGEYSGSTKANSVSQEFGVTFNNDMVYDPTDNVEGNDFWPRIHILDTHPITEGVESFGYYAGSSLNVDIPSEIIAKGDDDAYSTYYTSYPPVLAAIEYGLGKGVFCGDMTPLHSRNYPENLTDEEELLLSNILDWLLAEQANQLPACSLSANQTSGNAPLPVTFSSEVKESGKIIMFHNGRGPMCLEQLRFLEGLKPQYPSLVIEEHLTTEQSTREILNKLKSRYDKSEGVSESFGYLPITFVNNHAYSGFNQEIKEKLGKDIELMNTNDQDSPIISWSLDINNDGTPEYSGSGYPPSTQQHTYQNPDTYTAKLTVTDNNGKKGYCKETITVSQSEPVKVNAIIINDRRCGKQCDTTQLVLQLKGVFPGLDARYLDYSEQEAKDLMKVTNTEYLPAVIFDETVKEAEGYSNIERYIKESGKYLILQIGASFDPTAEICDNGIDDDGDGKIDCDDPDCEKEWVCMPKLAKPEVELFVMSHCPYGTQIEKGIFPVLELLGDKIDYSIKFCTYAMHGKKELDEQILQYCIQKDHKNKYLTYLRCFLKEGKTDECVEETGLDKVMLNLCIKYTDEQYKVTENFNDKSTWLNGRFPIFDIHKQSNEKYEIRGSPGFVVNGAVAQAGRDPASLLSAICTGFKDKPAECSVQLSTETPSPGFGFETPVPTCYDGIKNGDEEGVDCGGSCPDACAPEPTCYDGIQNGDEEGVDCGGSCPNECTDGSPDMEWNKTFGGSAGEWAYSVQQTTDGGYIIVGITNSYGAGYNDVWLIKTDSGGNEQWSKTFGGYGVDGAYSVQQTTDGGYIIAGVTNSSGRGYYDTWLIKTDSSGDEQWNKTFGGSGADSANSVQQTTDGGYIITGETQSSGARFGNDVWLIKTSSGGDEQWNKTFGGSLWDKANSVQQTTDGGYIIAGHYDSADYEAWLIKTNSSGDEQWNKTFGGFGWDWAYSVQQTIDGGYIIAGHSSGTVGYDAWLIKTDSDGNEQWNKTFGGSGLDFLYSVQQTTDGGYITTGSTSSFGSGSSDIWLIKIYPEFGNCSDNMQNRDETDIDCGGSCPACDN